MVEPVDSIAEGAAVGASLDVYRDVFVQMRGRLIGIAYLLGVDASSVDDVVDEAFAAALGPWRDGRISDLPAYLRRSVVNGVFSRGRQRRVRARWAASARPEPGGHDTEATIVERAWLRDALGRLPQDRRVAVVLRVCEDLSEREAAVVLGVPTGTVKSRTARGLAQLRTFLEEGDDDRSGK
jgi:RNA polymerase sigma factor (sigma-70 family)